MYLYNNIKITGAWKHADGRSIPHGWVEGATPEQLLDYDVEAVADPIVPDHDTETQRLTTLPSGQYEVINLTQEQLNENKVQAVSMAQARLALLQSGLLSGVDAAIASLPSPQKEAAQIEWEYQTQVVRSSGLVAGLVVALGISDQELDDLFNLAGTL